MQPPQVREIVDKVINTPFNALPSVLEGFSWRFEKVTASFQSLQRLFQANFVLARLDRYKTVAFAG